MFRDGTELNCDKLKILILKSDDKSLKTNFYKGNCENSSKMILNLIVVQERFWKDYIDKVKVNIMEDSLKTNFVQKKLWRFWKDDTELNHDTKTILKRWHWKSKN